MKGPEKSKEEAEERGMEGTQAAERRPTSCQAVWATHDVSPRKVTRPGIGE